MLHQHIIILFGILFEYVLKVNEMGLSLFFFGIFYMSFFLAHLNLPLFSASKDITAILILKKSFLLS
jgi:hypothetical protein